MMETLWEILKSFLHYQGGDSAKINLLGSSQLYVGKI
jgi:hypothetical protein